MFRYCCKTHGQYRAYSREMNSNVLRITFIVLISIVPLVLILYRTEVGDTIID